MSLIDNLNTLVTRIADEFKAVRSALPTKASLGLDQVNNTSDLDKPVSTAMQTALDLKANDADLHAIAKSGSYADLEDKPTIPTTAAEVGAATPADVANAVSTKQDALVSGTNIKTVNGQSVLGSGNLSVVTEASVKSALAASNDFRIGSMANAVNYLQATGSALGGNASLSAQGSEENVGLSFSMKGWRNIAFHSNNFAYRIFQISQTVAAPVNYLNVKATGVGNGPIVEAVGADANINVNITPKGTGKTIIKNAQFDGADLKTINGQSVLGNGDIEISVDLSSKADATDAVIYGSVVINSDEASSLVLNSTTPDYRSVSFRTGQKDRWFFGVDDVAETGSDAGSNFFLAYFDDVGSWKNNAFRINRASGLMEFDTTIKVKGVTESVVTASGATVSVDTNEATVYGITTTANATITLPAPARGKSFQIQISFGGAHTVAFNGGASQFALPYTPTSAAGKTDVIHVTCNAAGTKWLMAVFGTGFDT